LDCHFVRNNVCIDFVSTLATVRTAYIVLQ